MIRDLYVSKLAINVALFPSPQQGNRLCAARWPRGSAGTPEFGVLLAPMRLRGHDGGKGVIPDNQMFDPRSKIWFGGIRAQGWRGGCAQEESHTGPPPNRKSRKFCGPV